MTDTTITTITAVAECDPATTREKLALLRAVCALPEKPAALAEALTRISDRGGAGRLVRSCEARRILGGDGTPIAHSTLHNLVQAGKLHTYGPHRWRLFSLDELEALMREGGER